MRKYTQKKFISQFRGKLEILRRTSSFVYAVYPSPEDSGTVSLNAGAALYHQQDTGRLPTVIKAAFATRFPEHLEPRLLTTLDRPARSTAIRLSRLTHLPLRGVLRRTEAFAYLSAHRTVTQDPAHVA